MNLFSLEGMEAAVSVIMRIAEITAEREKAKLFVNRAVM